MLAEWAEAPDWTPWGQPRRTARGVETAQHHPLILIRSRGGSPRAVAPHEIPAGAEDFEWSPMLWALAGRRERGTTNKLGPQTVFGGADDRLYIFSDAACEQFFETGRLGPRGLADWTAALSRRIDFCEARGVAYRHLVIPDGPAIYADTILGAPQLSPERPLMQVLRAGGDRLRERLIYPLEALVSGRAVAETSLPHDVHMTGYGCFVCYREIVAALPHIDPAAVVREEDLRARQVLIAGDVARGLGLPGRRVDFHEPPPVKFRSVVKGTSFKTKQVDVWESEDSRLPRLTMFRTSNSTHLIPYLMRHFSRIAAVATTNVHYDLIESEKPDVVLCEMPERYFAPRHLGASETDRAAAPLDTDHRFEETTGHKLPLP